VQHPADGLAADVDRERGFRPLRHDAVQELAARAFRVRMGKPVAQVQPDLPVVRVRHERGEIVDPPRPDLASRER
jgi:hypothetical protein